MDYEIEKIETKSKIKIEKLRDTEKIQILEEIKCFKEILELQKQITKNRRK